MQIMLQLSLQVNKQMSIL